MKIGIGLPAAVPGLDATTIGTWAAEAERAGFASVGAIDRLVYDNLEPLTALAAAAARTEHVELLTTVLNVGWRANPVLLAKQMASVDLLSGGRLTAGLGLGGWPEDADATADHYIRHYYGDAGFPVARADTLTTPERIDDELDQLAKAGVTDLLLYPCSSDLAQIAVLTETTRPRLSPLQSA